jgi:hypothetical protein
MIYKVSSNFKGSLICKHFKKILYANSKIDITDNLFWENEIISLIRKGVFVPLDHDEQPVINTTVSKEETVKVIEAVKSTPDEHAFKPVIWDFQKQELEKAQRIEPAPAPTNVGQPDKDEEEESVEFVEPNKINTQEEIVPNEKKEKAPKIRKSKSSKNGITPVGTVKAELTQADAAIELDSRGNIVKNAIDILVEGRGFTDGEEIDFLDK